MKRLKDWTHLKYVVGDSVIAVPMLEVADLALCKEGILDRVYNKKVFADELELLDIIMDF